MRIPTFSRQTETDTTAVDERPTAAGATTSPVRPRKDDATTATLPVAPNATTTPKPAGPPPPPPGVTRPSGARPTETRPGAAVADPTPVGPKPRASLLATLGLVLGVAGALLVLSGPLLGYGIGVAGLALVLSLAGVRATAKRHVAGKSDALLGMALALGAIVIGVFALTGSLSWLGTDMQPVTSLREWLDAQFIDRI